MAYFWQSALYLRLSVILLSRGGLKVGQVFSCPTLFFNKGWVFMFYTPWNEAIPLAILELVKRIARPAGWIGFMILAILIGTTIFKAIINYFR